MYFIDDSGVALLLEIQSDLGFVINYDLADDDTITNLKLSFKQLNNLIDKLRVKELKNEQNWNFKANTRT